MHIQPRRVLLGIAVALVPLPVAAPAPVSAQGAPAASPSTPDWGIRAALAGKTTLSHNHFAYALPAGGAQVGDAVVVSNYTDAPLSFAVHGADMVSATGGGFAPAPEGVPATRVGKWIAVSQPSILVPPHREVSDAFTVTVPDAQQAGEQLGAIVVAPTTSGPAGLHLLTRAALTVDVTVLPGARLLAGAGPLNGTQQRDGEHFSLDVSNRGNVLFTFTGEVTVRDGAGRALATVPLSPDGIYVIPGGKATVTGTWSGLPLWGSVVATATIHARVSGLPETVATSAPLQLSFFPSAVVAGILATVLAMLAAAWWIRRRLRQPVPQTA